jgi:hypothetical protein
METVPILMWTVWGGFAVALLVLMIYRSSLTRYEEDAMYLDDSSYHQHKEFSDLMVKVKRVDPWVNVVGGVAGVLTFALAIFYMWDSIRQL